MAITLIFVDLPSPEPDDAATFYSQVMGWQTEGRPAGIFHQIVPGGEFLRADGSPSGVEHLHLGVFSTHEPRPDPRSETANRDVVSPRVYLKVDSRAEQDSVLNAAEKAGAAVLWRDQFWDEFKGWHGSFRDPWGTQIILWTESTDETSER
jgi:predicted enzyme related to lactoylglutathione lyase